MIVYKIKDDFLNTEILVQAPNFISAFSIARRTGLLDQTYEEHRRPSVVSGVKIKLADPSEYDKSGVLVPDFNHEKFMVIEPENYTAGHTASPQKEEITQLNIMFGKDSIYFIKDDDTNTVERGHPMYQVLQDILALVDREFPSVKISSLTTRITDFNQIIVITTTEGDSYRKQVSDKESVKALLDSLIDAQLTQTPVKLSGLWERV